MTVTKDPILNGRRRDSRPSLSQEIERLDSMLDGLAVAIPATIADCIKESVATAVAEAFKATLMEIAANPDIIALLSGARGLAHKTDSGPSSAKPTLVQRVRESAATACKRAVNGLKQAVRFIISPVQSTLKGTISTIQQINAMWHLRKPILISLSVGMVVGAIAYASAPWLAGTIAGCGAVSTTLLCQFAVWARRLYAGFSWS